MRQACVTSTRKRQGGFSAGRKLIGTGWNMFNTVLSPGDFIGDGKSDILARTATGRMYLYSGNAKEGFATVGTAIGTGWNAFNAVISSGDLTGLES